jgi:hypothetical protein
VIHPIEQAITTLVQQAPALDGAIVDALVDELRMNGSPLALTIARVVELVAEQLVDPGIALPALAMACATLCDRSVTTRELDAARYQIETLQPVPDRAPGTKQVVPEPIVPLVRLTRGPRPRT